MATEKPQEDPLVMTFAGGLIKHLGLQMYSGPVPSISELVANAWDAMATEVKISIPIDKAFSSTDEVTVVDNGHGMTYKECNDKYLLVGRDRRTKEGDLSQKFAGLKRRKVMSRKGIGKLAGFGIATIVEVRTIKDGVITHFQMDFKAMTKDEYVKSYPPKILADNGKKTRERSGTKITLKKLTVSKKVDGESFSRSMARRFTIISDPSFKVVFNGEVITKEELEFQFRYPRRKGKWITERLKGGKEIKWWIGFTKKPIRDDLARGIVVLARGKLVQTPWFFDISGGTAGQHGMQYMTGEVQADFLDSTDGEDLIATDRASVLWDEATSSVNLRAWGITKVKTLLKEWAARRGADKRKRPEIKKYLAYGDRLPPHEKKIFHDYIVRITSIPQIDEDEEILDELAKFGYNALTNQHFLDMIKQINAASASDAALLGEILSEWDIIEAISAAQQVKGRVEIIRKFREMIDDGVPEKPDMQEYIKQYPWLIDPAWGSLVHEKSLDTLLEKQFHLKRTGSQAGRTRPDYFCLAAANQYQVVDLKRPGIKVGMKELQQIQQYVMFLKDEAKKTTAPGMQVSNIGGILIYSDIKSGSGIDPMIESLKNVDIRVMTWENVFSTTKNLHQDFLKVIIERAPTDDPRIKALEEGSKKPAKKTPARRAVKRVPKRKKS